MTTYIHYIRALKAGAIINDYNNSFKLSRLLVVRDVKAHIVTSDDGFPYTEYRYEPPIATVNENLTVADVDLKATYAPLAVVARIRLADKIRWQDGKRIVSEQWSGKAYPVTGNKDGFVLLDTGHGIIGRKAENVKAA